MSQVGLPTRTKVDPAIRRPLDLNAKLSSAPGRPRVVRMPSDWWDAPSVMALTLTPGPQPARSARRFTRSTLTRWNLDPLIEDAEVIVAEFVANALCHGGQNPEHEDQRGPARADTRIGLRLFRRAGEVMCAVLDPSDAAPVLKAPIQDSECGRGLQLVDALSDVWGRSEEHTSELQSPC